MEYYNELEYSLVSDDFWSTTGFPDADASLMQLFGNQPKPSDMPSEDKSQSTNSLHWVSPDAQFPIPPEIQDQHPLEIGTPMSSTHTLTPLIDLDRQLSSLQSSPSTETFQTTSPHPRESLPATLDPSVEPKPGQRLSPNHGRRKKSKIAHESNPNDKLWKDFKNSQKRHSSVVRTLISNEKNGQRIIQITPTHYEATKPSQRYSRPFITFCSRMRPIVRRQHPLMANLELMRIIGQKWNELPDYERDKYRGSTTGGFHFVDMTSDMPASYERRKDGSSMS